VLEVLFGHPRALLCTSYLSHNRAKSVALMGRVRPTSWASSGVSWSAPAIARRWAAVCAAIDSQSRYSLWAMGAGTLPGGVAALSRPVCHAREQPQPGRLVAQQISLVRLTTNEGEGRRVSNSVSHRLPHRAGWACDGDGAWPAASAASSCSTAQRVSGKLERLAERGETGRRGVGSRDRVRAGFSSQR